MSGNPSFSPTLETAFFFLATVIARKIVGNELKMQMPSIRDSELG